LALNVLDHILMGTPASPLRKALIDSGLGEDIAGGGLEDELRQHFFAAGLKGTSEKHAETIEKLIFDTLQHLVDEGIDRKTVEASLNTIEFMLREMNTGRFPRGLLLYIRALAFWLYDADPIAPLAFEAPLEQVKKQALEGEGYFEGLIRQYFLQNPHRTRLTLYPDPDLKQIWEEQEAARLLDEKSRMTERDLALITEEMEALRHLQEDPDDPEALAAIPRLKLKDLDKKIRTIPTQEQTLGDGKALFHDLATNGILYLDAAMNLATLPTELIPYVPLYARALVHMGNKDEDFVSLSQRIGSKTGGITTRMLLSTSLNERLPVTRLVIRSKATVKRTEDLTGILRDILLTTQFDDKERFRQILLEEKARQESSLIPMGHMVVNQRLRAHFTISDWLNEQMNGVSYLFFLRDLLERLDENWPDTLEKLRRINNLLVGRNNILWNITLDEKNWLNHQNEVTELIQSLPDHQTANLSWQMEDLPHREGLTIPAQVNYVAKGASLYDIGYELHGSIFAINTFLRTSWLWEQVRMKGGAYGALYMFDYRSGVFDFVSYRDPNLLDTLTAYDATADFLKQTRLDKDEIVKSIIGAIGKMDAYLLPDAKGYTELTRYLTKEDNHFRQQLRDQLLAVKTSDFRDFGDALSELNKISHIVVLGGEESIDEANQQLNPSLSKTKVL
jgi:Zn-dependent M16 (insulinase) family peptidase